MKTPRRAYLPPLLLLGLAALLLAGCVRVNVMGDPHAAPEEIYQYSTIGALLEGVYQGGPTVESLTRRGDLGLGTFDALDGEMVVLDGTVYQVKVDGAAAPAPPGLTTPFAVVTWFDSEIRVPVVGDLDLKGLEERIQEKLPSPNLFYAVRIRGKFPYVKTRSVPAQKKPYPRLAEAAKGQIVRERRDVEGDVVGFYSPPYVAGGLNVAGFHLHFLDKTRTQGGHLLDLQIKEAVVELDQVPSLKLDLPTEGDFLTYGMEKGSGEELHRIER